MTDFLLELRSEEIPARMQAKAREDLARLFSAELEKAGLKAGAVTTYATPRRLALIAHDLPAETAAVSEELKGPRVGAPPQALEGFLRKTGLTADQLTERDGVLFAVIERAGQATADVLAQAIPAIIRAFPWPKSMRWGAASLSTESLRWVRPLQGIVALFGDDVVACEIAGIASGRTTMGHRFHAPGPIEIASAATYADQLRDAHVIVSQDERAQIIALGAKLAAQKAGLALVEDEGLLIENAGLTEWPVPLLGRFDADFLSVPPEVIQLTARVNQKYFVCRGGDGKLANAFICTANIDAADGGAKIIEGNRKVLAARLSDAKFFYDTDLKVPLEEQAAKLDRIVFHEKLGTVADKVARVAKLAKWLVEEGIVTANTSPARGGGPFATANGGGVLALPSQSFDSPAPYPTTTGSAGGPPPRAGEVLELAALAERAARLCKADLVTGMVGEFPELQGVMGGYYALAQGEDPRVAAAIRDHYKPVGQGDDVPTDPVTVAVSLADKLDTLCAFFGAGLKPTGSKDPFALRRAMLAVLQVMIANGLRASFARLFWQATTELKYLYSAQADLFDFAIDRLKVQQREAGVRHDLIDAVFALGGEDDLVRLLARVRALQSFITTEDGANLLAGYKRAANILKKEGYAPLPKGEGGAPSGAGGEGAAPTAASDALTLPRSALPPSPDGRGKLLSYTPEIAEAALITALDAAEPAAADAIAREDFEGAMAALATLRAPIDAFFDKSSGVMVNDPDPAKRAARLALLARVRDACHAVADFSKIEG